MKMWDKMHSKCIIVDTPTIVLIKAAWKPNLLSIFWTINNNETVIFHMKNLSKSQYTSFNWSLRNWTSFVLLAGSSSFAWELFMLSGGVCNDQVTFYSVVNILLAVTFSRSCVGVAVGVGVSWSGERQSWSRGVVAPLSRWDSITCIIISNIFT